MWISSVGNKGKSRARLESGVTLLELVVVMAILALLAGLVTPGIGHWIDDWKLRGAAERIAQIIRYARTRALYEQSYYLVELRPQEHRVRVLEPASGFIREYDLSPNIQWEEEGNPSSSSVFRLVLPPSGAVEERTVTLRHRKGGSVKIHLDFLIGSPGVEVARQGS